MTPADANLPHPVVELIGDDRDQRPRPRRAGTTSLGSLPSPLSGPSSNYFLERDQSEMRVMIKEGQDEPPTAERGWHGEMA